MKHTCHWPGCNTVTPPKMWGCKMHWYMLPKHLRDRIWATYVPGQEIRKDPSDEYMSVINMVDEWIRNQASMAFQGADLALGSSGTVAYTQEVTADGEILITPISEEEMRKEKVRFLRIYCRHRKLIKDHTVEEWLEDYNDIEEQ